MSWKRSGVAKITHPIRNVVEGPTERGRAERIGGEKTIGKVERGAARLVAWGGTYTAHIQNP